MKIEHLRYFAEVGQCSSLSMAARKLFVSPQGLSKALASIEAELGTKLVERHSNGVELTDEGCIFLEGARRMLESYDATLCAIEASHNPPTSFEEAGIELFATPYALATLSKDLPASTGIVKEAPFDEIVALLKKSGCLSIIDVFSNTDLAGEAQVLGLTNDCYRLVPLFDTKLGILAPENSPLAALDEISAGELKDQSIALIKDPTIRTALRRIYGEEGHPNIVFETTNAGAFIGKIREGRSIGLLDSFAYQQVLIEKQMTRHVIFVPLAVDLIDTVCFAWRKDSPMQDAYSAYASLVEAKFRNRISRESLKVSQERRIGANHAHSRRA